MIIARYIEIDDNGYFFTIIAKKHHKFFGYNHRRSNRLNKGIMK
jgi:hypothetical protein